MMHKHSCSTCQHEAERRETKSNKTGKTTCKFRRKPTNYLLTELGHNKTCVKYEKRHTCENCMHRDYSHGYCHSNVPENKRNFRFLSTAQVGVSARDDQKTCDFWNVPN